MSMIPFDFGVHETSQSFIGNGSSKTFAFTDVPATEKTDIQLLIYDESTLSETIISYDHFTFIRNSSYIGFTITLDSTIAAPNTTQVLIAKLVRNVKNVITFPDGSDPKPMEFNIAFQGACLSTATLLGMLQGVMSFRIADISQNIDSLSLPLIDTNIDKFTIALRKKTNGKYELYYDTSIIENAYSSDIAEISDNYIATSADNIILFKSGSGSGKNITLYHHLNIQDGYSRYIQIMNESNNTVDIKYNNVIIHNLPSLSSCFYKIDSSGQYSVVL